MSEKYEREQAIKDLEKKVLAYAIIHEIKDYELITTLEKIAESLRETI